MALPARLLEQLPPAVMVGARAGGGFGPLPAAGAAGPLEGALPFGVGALDSLLPDGGLPRGAVTELAVVGGAGLASSLSLAACRSAQEQARLRGGEAAWCAFVDPGVSLHAPAVLAAGVTLERLLVVRPPPEALSRVTVRLAESQVFAVVVVDLVGVPGLSGALGGPSALGKWARAVRRLSLAVASTDGCVLLLTAREAPRPVPLPVALRLELQRVGRHQLRVQVAKERRGRIADPVRIELVPGLRGGAAGAGPGGAPRGVDAAG